MIHGGAAAGTAGTAAPRCSRRAFTFAAALGCLAPATRAAAAPACIVPIPRLLVADASGRRLSVLDAATLQALARIDLSPPLCAEPKYTPDGRFAFYCTTGGGLFKYDLRELAAASAVRTGTEVRDLAVSADGKWVLLGNATPQNLLLFDAQLNLVRTYPASSLDAKTSSAVASVHDAGPRRSFVVSFERLPQLWEISYDPAAEPIFDGLVHDYRMAEALAAPGYLGVRRTPLDQPMAVAAFDEPHRHVLGPARAPAGQAAPLDVVNLDVRRRIVQLPLRMAPSPGQATAFTGRGGSLIAIADAADAGSVRFIATNGWRSVHTLRVGADALSLASHPQARDLWVASSQRGQDRVTLTLVAKDTLEPRAVLELAGGGPASIAFTCDGAHALVRRPADAEMVAVHDARSGAELRRLP